MSNTDEILDDNKADARRIYLSELQQNGKEKDAQLIRAIEDNKISLYAFRDDSFRGRFKNIVGVLKGFIENSDAGKKLSLDSELAGTIHLIASTLLYILNSTSFEKGKMFEFDRIEIEGKLKRITGGRNEQKN